MTHVATLSRRLLTIGAAVGLGLTLLPASPAAAATGPIPRSFFGMHNGDTGSYPTAPVGAVRLWDAGVSWREIETAPGRYDFTRVDARVNAARAHGAAVLLVLGQTPQFHSTKPGTPGWYGLGAAAMPTEAAWKNYVSGVVKHFKGRGVDYQVWNEANVVGYWRGTAQQMATLTRLASTIVNRNDPSAKVVSPAMAVRLPSQRSWLRTYYAQKTGGRKVATYVDIVSLNLYPLASQKPEASMTLLATTRNVLRAAGVRKPIWNTEINYGLLGGGNAKTVSAQTQAAYVGRTFLLNAASDMKRVYWYSWNLQALANTSLTSADGVTLTEAGTAYSVVRSWLLGSRINGCPRDGHGTYTCTMTYSGGVKRVYWNPSRNTSVHAVASARAAVNLLGSARILRGGERIAVTASPVMVRSAR
jgi:hypothetical protein